MKICINYILKHIQNLGICQGGSANFSASACSSVNRRAASVGREICGKANAGKNQILNVFEYKNFITPLSRTCSSVIFSVAYKVMSLAMWSLQKKEAQNTYRLISAFYWQKADAIYAYYLFGNNIIQPSVNIEKIKNLRKPLNQATIEQFINMANRQKAASIAEIKRDHFPKQKITDGICTSLALNFTSQLLKANPGNLAEAASSIGSRFTEGATVKTGIIHGIQNSLSYSSSHRRSENLLLDYFDTVARLYNVRLTPTSLNCQFSTWKGAENFLSSQLNRLEDGIYLVHESGAEIGHVAAYIKCQNQRFLFDPQLGTIRIPENKDSEYLIKSTRAASCNELNFFKCS